MVCFGLALLAAVAAPARAGEALSLHPRNPRYLQFRGAPTVLITSGEHYGAVLNLDFDYVPYLDELADKGLNLTRTFSGVYCESARSFNIERNPLAPAAHRYLCPWARSATPGYANGGAKFDLTKWDEAYFARLRDFMARAGARGIVVEYVFFCPFYEDEMWNLSPMNAANNVNGIGAMARTDVYTLKDAAMQAVHEAFVRKVVAALNEYDNLYYEICNEPYFGGVTLEWQRRIADTIVAAEEGLAVRHLIAQNIANGKAKVVDPHPAVSIFNFHYARPPEAVAMNLGLNRVIADDETGFAGGADATYRREGWDFIIAGGGIYSNLDYSFAPGCERGTAQPEAPGGGGAVLRRQLGILKDFIHGFDFPAMGPHNEIVKGGVPAKATVRVLAQPGHVYAVYVNGGSKAELALELPAGAYKARWVDTKTGAVAAQEAFSHEGGVRTLVSPAYTEDIALGIMR